MTAEYMCQKFSKGDGKCRCNKAMETSGHVLHECQCDANSLGREQLTHKIHGSIRDLGLVAAGAVTPDWGWFLSQKCSLWTKDGSTEIWAKNTVPDWALWSQSQPIPREAKKNPDVGTYVWGVNVCGKGLFPVCGPLHSNVTPHGYACENCGEVEWQPS
jgi:hypothetical protein